MYVLALGLPVFNTLHVFLEFPLPFDFLFDTVDTQKGHKDVLANHLNVMLNIL